jgi:hypothetical protein
MSTVANSQPGVKAGRTIRVLVGPTDVNPCRVVVIRDGAREDHYTVRPLPADFGLAFEVEKFLPAQRPAYQVLLADEGRHSCECKGFCARGTCRHVAGLLALRQAGQL